jgi:YHS domain-containing protein
MPHKSKKEKQTMKKVERRIMLLGIVLVVLAGILALAQETAEKGAAEQAAPQAEKQVMKGGCCAMGAGKDAKAQIQGCPMKSESEKSGAKECPFHKQGGQCPMKAELKNPQTTCPIMAGPINKNISAEQKGKKVYFCCEECQQEFKKNPDKYMKEMEDKGITLENTCPYQKNCPKMSGENKKNCCPMHAQGKKGGACSAGQSPEGKKGNPACAGMSPDECKKNQPKCCPNMQKTEEPGKPAEDLKEAPKK